MTQIPPSFVRFGGVYKARMTELPEGKKTIDYAHAVERYLKEQLGTDNVRMASHHNYDNGAFTHGADRAKTLWFVADDAKGDHYTQFKAAREGAMDMVDNAGKLGNKTVVPGSVSLSLVLSVMVRETAKSAAEPLAHLRMLPTNLKLRRSKDVSELTFKPEAKQPGSFIESVQLVKGKL